MGNQNATPSRHQRPRAPQLIDREQLQELWGVSRATLWRITSSGALPVVYIDGRPRFLLEDVEAFVESRRTREGRKTSEITWSHATSDVPLSPNQARTAMEGGDLLESE